MYIEPTVIVVLERERMFTPTAVDWRGDGMGAVRELWTIMAKSAHACLPSK